MERNTLGRPPIKPPLSNERRPIDSNDDREDMQPTPPKPSNPPEDDTASKKLDAILGAINSLAEKQVVLERRLDAQQTIRKRTQEASRMRNVQTIVTGRNGEQLSRSNDDTINPFELPQEFVEVTRGEGYDLEWKTENVMGKDLLTYQAKMHANGWRPVPNIRLPGLYAPEGDTGPVRYEGMVLMERPLSLTMEAREEERRKACDQVQMKHDSWGVETKNNELFNTTIPEVRQLNIRPRSTIEISDPSWQPRLEISAGED